MSIDLLSAQCKALGDPVRLRIAALCRSGEVAVGELADVLGQSQPRISQHLRTLCDAGITEGVRDGKRVFYRFIAPETAPTAGLVDAARDSCSAADDAARLRELRVTIVPPEAAVDDDYRQVARALIELTVAAPVGDLLDIGCGRGALLKLLASRANRAVGVDIDADARSVARAALFLAGVDNCSLRPGDMYRLPFDDRRFDTIILDDVLLTAKRPAAALAEARRVLRPGGRLIVLSAAADDPDGAARKLAELSRLTALRMAAPRRLPGASPAWLLAVMTPADASDHDAEAA